MIASAICAGHRTNLHCKYENKQTNKPKFLGLNFNPLATGIFLKKILSLHYYLMLIKAK